mgnify:CR=1 FL=1
MEEPEAFKHPAALRQTARVYVQALAHENQIVVATHSLELIDELVAELQRVGQIDDLAVIRLALRDGEMSSSVFPGESVVTAREVLREDLR